MRRRGIAALGSVWTVLLLATAAATSSGAQDVLRFSLPESMGRSMADLAAGGLALNATTSSASSATVRRLVMPLAVPLQVPDDVDAPTADGYINTCATHCRHTEVPLGCAAATVLFEWHFVGSSAPVSPQPAARLGATAPCLLWPHSALPGLVSMAWDPADGGHRGLLERIASAHGAAAAAEADLIGTSPLGPTGRDLGATAALELMVIAPVANRALRSKSRQGRSTIFAVLPEDHEQLAATPLVDWVASSQAAGDEEAVWMVCHKRAAFTAVRAIIDGGLGQVLTGAARWPEPENGTLLMLRDVDAVLVRSGAALALASRGVLVVDSLAPGQCIGHGAGRAAAVLHRLSEVYALRNGTAWGSRLPPRFFVLMRPATRLDVAHLHGRLRLRDPRQLVFAAGRVRWSGRFSRMDGAPYDNSGVQQLERDYRDAAHSVARLRREAHLRQRFDTTAAAAPGGPVPDGASAVGIARSNVSDDAEIFLDQLKAARLGLQRKFQRWKRYSASLRASWATERLACPEVQYGLALSSRAVEEIVSAARTPLGFGRCSALAGTLGPADFGEQLACAAAHVLSTDDFGIGLFPEHDPALFLSMGL